ncbi:hypothetical protein PNEG_02270 [Pneumocystis murina B123]|uniref:Uncharacterized protein n=1 Tax=Pneumocystis murina (strain B123) TaxID=1069680 RepID=M7NQE9_PNEMU|nr:hypothetical protein PNEG_02270 [Pneumocystis murina B123]EMR09311.1 hypothetical protein PNEG_02270 [Pneumocystis murina B123]
MDIISSTECSVPGCIVSLLRLILPKSFVISHNKSDPVKTVGETINDVVEQVPTIVTGLTSCLSLHAEGDSRPRSDHNSSNEGIQESNGGISDASNNGEVLENTGGSNSRKNPQNCIVM